MAAAQLGDLRSSPADAGDQGSRYVIDSGERPFAVYGLATVVNSLSVSSKGGGGVELAGVAGGQARVRLGPPPPMMIGGAACDRLGRAGTLERVVLPLSCGRAVGVFHRAGDDLQLLLQQPSACRKGMP